MMKDNYPSILTAIKSKCEELEFDMASDETAGSLLRTLVASKPNGRFLELCTGIGTSLCWILDGMDTRSSIISIDNDPKLMENDRFLSAPAGARSASGGPLSCTFQSAAGRARNKAQSNA